MEIINLPPGEEAPDDSDCISVQQLPDGTFNLTGAALCGEESVALVSDMLFETEDQANQAGLAWAAAQGVEQLYVATSTA